MTRHKTRTRRSASEVVLPLLVAFVGIGGAVACYYLIPGFQPVELVAIIVAVVFAAVGYTQDILRGLISVLFAYLATGVAATFYVPVAPFVGAPFGDEVTDPIRALSFLVLTALVWIVLEAITRALIPDTSLPALGFLDHLGGLAVYLVLGVVVASLLFNASGYLPRWRRQHDAARLRPQFNQVVSLLYGAQSFWFGERPPRFYVYDLAQE